MAYLKCGEPERDNKAETRPPTTMGLASFKHEPLLARILVIVALTQVLTAVLDIRFQTKLFHEIPLLDQQTAFSGNFYSVLNVASFLLQFIAAPLALSLLPRASSRDLFQPCTRPRPSLYFSILP